MILVKLYINKAPPKVPTGFVGELMLEHVPATGDVISYGDGKSYHVLYRTWELPGLPDSKPSSVTLHLERRS